MAEVGVRVLKSRLSECLRRVRDGEHLVITDRGRAVATISRIESAPVVEWAQELVSRGEARWSGGKPRGLKARVPGGGTPTSRMVIQDRR